MMKLFSLLNLLTWLGLCIGTKPVLDLSNNMRHVLIPSSTRPNTIIYRLRASDADDDYPLQFFINDKKGGRSSHLRVENTDCSYPICSADVILTDELKPGEVLRFSLTVQDTKGERTVVDAVLNVTRRLEAFHSGPQYVVLAEDSPVGRHVASFNLANNPDLYRGVSCHLRQVFPLMRTNKPVFVVKKELTPNDWETKCTVYLQSKIDYEDISSYILQIIAENAWTDSEFDSRNLATTELMVAVQNVADTPPIFTGAPPVTRIPENVGVGDFVMMIVARDGDSGIGRKIRYSIDPRYSHYGSYFALDPYTGRMTVKKSLQDLEDEVGPGIPILLRIIAQEVEDPREVLQQKNALEDQSASTEIAIIIDDVINRKPNFLQKKYITTVPENVEPGTKLVFEGGLDIVEDRDKGQNGVLQLSIQGHEDTFEISPAIIEQSGQFVITVKNNQMLDSELYSALEFTITATEMGPARLSDSALVQVNIQDMNDNAPVFSEEEYRVTIYENITPGTKILQVKALDADRGANGEVRYTKITGDSVMLESLVLDEKTGDITVTNTNLIDRETRELYILGVEARDGGKDGGNVATARIVINVEDVNDVPPKFKKRKYEGFMSPDLSKLRNEVQVEAVDLDKTGTQNSKVRYEIIRGNYDNKFSIDEQTGVISVVEPLTNSQSSRSSRALENIEPIITLHVRAYDNGIPSLDSQVPVNIFTEDVSSRVVKFIIPESVEKVEENQNQISDLISTITGGEAEIQDVRPYSWQDESLETLNLGRNRRVDLDSEPKSVVDVFVRYPATSIVDVDAIKYKLNGEQRQDPNYLYQGGVTGNDGVASIDRVDTEVANIAEKESNSNLLLFALIALVAAIIVTLILIIICCCTPGCLLARGMKNKVRPMSPEETEMYTGRSERGGYLETESSVSNGSRGQPQPRERSLHGLIESARTRIKSASNSIKERREAWSAEGRRIWHVISRDRDNNQDDGQITIKILGDAERPHRSSNIYIIEDRGNTRDSNINPAPNSPSILRHAHGGSSYRSITRGSRLGSQVIGNSIHGASSSSSSGVSVPEDQNRIFKRRSAREASDVQVMRLEEDRSTGKRNEFTQVGNAEVLTLDSTNGFKTHPRRRQERARSEGDDEDYISPEDAEGGHRGQSDDDEAEFYSAIGPDGKEIILRRYLHDQSDPVHRIGFVNQALSHLYQNQRHEDQPKRQELRGQRNQDTWESKEHRGRDYPEDSMDDDDSLIELEDGGSNRHQRYQKNIGDRPYQDEYENNHQRRHFYDHYHEQGHGYDDRPNLPGGYVDGVDGDPEANPDISPKHKIQTPIIEETASGIERALLSRQTSRATRRWSGQGNEERWGSTGATRAVEGRDGVFVGGGGGGEGLKDGGGRRVEGGAYSDPGRGREYYDRGQRDHYGGWDLRYREGMMVPWDQGPRSYHPYYRDDLDYHRRGQYDQYPYLPHHRPQDIFVGDHSPRSEPPNLGTNYHQRVRVEPLHLDDLQSNSDPQYTETKSSILRRKHSNAKLSAMGRGPDLNQGSKKKRKYGSLSDLQSLRLPKDSSRPRRNSWSTEDLSTARRDYESLNQSQAFSHREGEARRFSQYTGLNAKEKIEYAEYPPNPDFRQPGDEKRRFSSNRNFNYDYEREVPSLEFTYDMNGDIVSNSSIENRSTYRRRERIDSKSTPRYMDWYTRQKEQQKELQQERQREMQQLQEKRQQQIQQLRIRRQQELVERQKLENALRAKNRNESPSKQQSIGGDSGLLPKLEPSEANQLEDDIYHEAEKLQTDLEDDIQPKDDDHGGEDSARSLGPEKEEDLEPVMPGEDKEYEDEIEIEVNVEDSTTDDAKLQRLSTAELRRKQTSSSSEVVKPTFEDDSEDVLGLKKTPPRPLSAEVLIVDNTA